MTVVQSVVCIKSTQAHLASFEKAKQSQGPHTQSVEMCKLTV
jgi:hypothetical protein